MKKYKSSSTESTACTLTRILSEDETMSFVRHAGSYDEAQQLVRVRRKRKSKGKNMTIEDKKNLSKDHKRFVTEIVLGLEMENF